MTGGSSPRNKGARYENEVVKWLREMGWPNVERRIAGMGADRGDITGWPGVCLDPKNRNRLELGVWMNQLEQRAAEARAEVAALVIKRRGTIDVGRHYVVMEADTFALLMSEAGR
jgi:Holliday junction resolvase